MDRGGAGGRGWRRVRPESPALGSELTCGAARAAGGRAAGGRAAREAERAAGAAERAASRPRLSEGGGGEARAGGRRWARGCGLRGPAGARAGVAGRGAAAGLRFVVRRAAWWGVGAGVRVSGRSRARAAIHAPRRAWDREPEPSRARAAGVGAGRTPRGAPGIRGRCGAGRRRGRVAAAPRARRAGDPGLGPAGAELSAPPARRCGPEPW